MKRTEVKRQNIIDAALEEFRMHGFEGARTTRIAKAADVSSRTLYKHFPTKETLFEAIIEIAMKETAAIPSADFDPEQPLRDQLIAALRLYMMAITDDHYLSLNRVVMSEYLRDPELAKRVFERSELSNSPLKAFLASAVESELIREVDLDHAVSHLTAGAKAHFFWPKFLIGAKPAANWEDTLGECVDMFLSLYEA